MSPLPRYFLPVLSGNSLALSAADLAATCRAALERATSHPVLLHEGMLSTTLTPSGIFGPLAPPPGPLRTSVVEPPFELIGA